MREPQNLRKDLVSALSVWNAHKYKDTSIELLF